MKPYASSTRSSRAALKRNRNTFKKEGQRFPVQRIDKAKTKLQVLSWKLRMESQLALILTSESLPWGRRKMEHLLTWMLTIKRFNWWLNFKLMLTNRLKTSRIKSWCDEENEYCILYHFIIDIGSLRSRLVLFKCCTFACDCPAVTMIKFVFRLLS